MVGKREVFEGTCRCYASDFPNVRFVALALGGRVGRLRETPAATPVPIRGFRLQAEEMTAKDAKELSSRALCFFLTDLPSLTTLVASAWGLKRFVLVRSTRSWYFSSGRCHGGVLA